jgi:multidrug efflux system membrane fusion protein
MQLLSLSSSQRVAARSILAILGAAMLVSACSRPAPPEEPVRSVKVITVGLGAFESGQEYAGEVRARVESRLGFRVAGKITKRTVEVGQRVKAGQLLAQLDPRDYQLAADAGRAQVVSATTQRDLAAADLTRYRALKDQNFISGAELERREATLKAAQATLEQPRPSRRGRATRRVTPSCWRMCRAWSRPWRRRPVRWWRPVPPWCASPRTARVTWWFAVPEDKLARVPVGSAVTVRSWNGGPTLRGTVRELAASADPVTRTFPVKVTLSEKDAGEALPLGATAYVVPQAAAQLAGGVIKLPTSALRQEGKGSAVWVLDTATMTVRSQPVEIATADGNEAVIASGLQPGQKVVSAGVHVLSPGQKVTIYKPNGPDPIAERSSNAMKSGASAPAAPVAPTSASAPAASSSAPATR